MKWLLAALVLAGCTTAAGPSTPQLREALARAPEARALADSELRVRNCLPFDEEPTEFTCQFDVKAASREWKAHSAIITYDKGWLLLSLD